MSSSRSTSTSEDLEAHFPEYFVDAEDDDDERDPEYEEDEEEDIDEDDMAHDVFEDEDEFHGMRDSLNELEALQLANKYTPRC